MQAIQLLQSTMAPYSLPTKQSPNQTATGMGAKCCLAPDRCAAPQKLAHPDPCQEAELQWLRMESAQRTVSHHVGHDGALQHLWACRALQHLQKCHPQARWALHLWACHILQNLQDCRPQAHRALQALCRILD